MLPDDHPDRIQIAFDDHRLVVNARPAPSRHAGPASGPAPSWLTGTWAWVDGPGRANTGNKVMTLVASALAGG